MGLKLKTLFVWSVLTVSMLVRRAAMQPETARVSFLTRFFADYACDYIAAGNGQQNQAKVECLQEQGFKTLDFSATSRATQAETQHVPVHMRRFRPALYLL